MWIPASATEVEEAATAGRLIETASFDAKAELPSAKKTLDLAIDVAAMSTEGGVLLYGVAQDEHNRPTVPAPIKLAGAADRVAQIVQTSISEVPRIDVRELLLGDDQRRGYLLIVVPRSARAPHQVIAGKEFRYYGRGATGNRLLTQGEVALLYERRERWEVDRDDLLEETIAAMGFPQNDPADMFMFAVIKPVASDTELVARAASSGDVVTLLKEAREAATEQIGGYLASPSLSDAVYVQLRGADGWDLHKGLDREPRLPGNLAVLRVDRDGTMRLFSGRAGGVLEDELPHHPRRVIFEGAIAGNTALAFAIAGSVYERAGYFGDVDVAVACTNIGGAFSFYYRNSRRFWPDKGYGSHGYRRTRRVSGADLSRTPKDLVRELYGQMFEITLPPGMDPFELGRR